MVSLRGFGLLLRLRKSSQLISGKSSLSFPRINYVSLVPLFISQDIKSNVPQIGSILSLCLAPSLGTQLRLV